MSTENCLLPQPPLGATPWKPPDRSEAVERAGALSAGKPPDGCTPAKELKL